MIVKRPHYLNLLQLRLPVGGWVSILHRVSGVALSLAVPIIIYVFALSLDSPEGFAGVSAFLSGGFGMLLLLGVVWATLHHLLAGLRHLGFDLGLGESKARARLTAWIVLAAALGLAGLFALDCLA